MKYRVYGVVTGTKYMGVYEANSKDEAIEKSIEAGEAYVSICHQCAHAIDDAQIFDIEAEETDES